jgi:hypothetical protein
MWTTDLGRYALIEVDSSRPNACAIKDLKTGGLVVIDEEDDVYYAVIKNMREAGAPVTREEAKQK